MTTLSGDPPPPRSRFLAALVAVLGVVAIAVLGIAVLRLTVFAGPTAPEAEQEGSSGAGSSETGSSEAGASESNQGRVILTPPTLEPSGAASFVVSSFNVLGNNHTINGARGREPGTKRIRWAAQLLETHEVSVAGLQEFQIPLKEFRKVAPQFAMYPGDRLGHRLTQNSIIWDRDVWAREQVGTTPIPYFKGRLVRMPHVLLRHRETGQQVWFMNYHNPAQVNGPAGRWRREATSLEAELANELMQEAPVVMTGDFNAREPFFCQISAEAALHSADGGYRADDECVPPADPVVDWILGSPEVAFTDSVIDRSKQVKRVSDHAMIRASVVITDEDPE